MKSEVQVRAPKSQFPSLHQPLWSASSSEPHVVTGGPCSPWVSHRGAPGSSGYAQHSFVRWGRAVFHPIFQPSVRRSCPSAFAPSKAGGALSSLCLSLFGIPQRSCSRIVLSSLIPHKNDVWRTVYIFSYIICLTWIRLVIDL